eukprot:366575-Chlamydomonas_euryale.AAC.11
MPAQRLQQEGVGGSDGLQKKMQGLERGSEVGKGRLPLEKCLGCQETVRSCVGMLPPPSPRTGFVDAFSICELPLIKFMVKS